MSTLKDVAQRAGVSSITVSRVINTPELVKEKTKDKVMLAMAELKYVPNAAAKSLAVNRTGLIDVFIPSDIDLNNPFVMHFIAGISNALSKRMYPFLILRDKKKEHLCDGYIVTGLLRDEINEFYAYAVHLKPNCCVACFNCVRFTPSLPMCTTCPTSTISTSNP